MTFTQEDEFSWVRAWARTLGLWSLSYALLALLMLAAGAELIPGRRPDSTPMDPGYLLIAWVGLQGFYPVFLRANPSNNDYRPQSPRFLRLLLMSQATGLVLLAVLLTPLAGLQAHRHPAGSLVAEIPEDATAWLAFYGYALAMLAWPVASGLFMLRMTARWNTLLIGVAIGGPMFLVSLIGGLLLAVFRMLTPSADIGALLLLFGALGLSGAAVYLILLLWYRASVAREPLGPPPADDGPFRAAATPAPTPTPEPPAAHPSRPQYLTPPLTPPLTPSLTPPGPVPTTFGPAPWASLIGGALLIWAVLWALVTVVLWLAGESGAAAVVVISVVVIGPLSLFALHRPGIGLWLGHRRLPRALWASLGVGVAILLLTAPLWAGLGLLPPMWWRPPLGAPVLDLLIAALFILGSTLWFHSGVLCLQRSHAAGVPRPVSRLVGWALIAASLLSSLLFASVWVDAIAAGDSSIRLGSIAVIASAALLGWPVHLIASRPPAQPTPPSSPRGASSQVAREMIPVPHIG
ncbi:hypothetical protein RIL96_10940, partial [Nesterenkonia sp. LY-0111]|nr:hypothetical protein [Nesterenkonia sp. LY-0111]